VVPLSSTRNTKAAKLQCLLCDDPALDRRPLLSPSPHWVSGPGQTLRVPERGYAAPRSPYRDGPGYDATRHLDLRDAG
jgi:hypothetical protein